MYLYVEVDLSRIHKYLQRLYFEAQIGGGDIKFSVLFKGKQKSFKNSSEGTDVFSIYVSSSRSPPLVTINDTSLCPILCQLLRSRSFYQSVVVALSDRKNTAKNTLLLRVQPTICKLPFTMQNKRKQ